VRRRPVFQRVQQEAEFAPGLLFTEAQGLENQRLNLSPVDPDAAAADLGAVQDQVIGPGMDPARICLDQRNFIEDRM